MSVKRIDQLLDANPGLPLGKIVQHARHMEDLTRQLRAALAGPLGEHLVAANVNDDGSLVLICSSASWAARLRFESERLTAAAARAGVRVARVRVRIASS